MEFVWPNGYLGQLCGRGERGPSTLRVPAVKYGIRNLLYIDIHSNMVPNRDNLRASAFGRELILKVRLAKA